MNRYRVTRSSVSKGHGFTLLEVLIAVAVVSIALVAIISETSRDVRNAALLRDRSIAQWVAMNKVTEWTVNQEWLSSGKQKGDSAMAGRDWFWQVDVIDTDDKDVRRLDISVMRLRDDEEPLIKLIAYLGRPATR